MEHAGPAVSLRPAATTPRALMALTFVTGVVDATSFLALGGVFSAMMTGNVVFLGLGLSDSVDSSVTGPLVAIAAYLVAGAAAALLAGRSAGALFGTPASNAVEIALLAAATAVAALAAVDADAASGYAILALLAASMGWRTTNVRALGSVNVPTAVLNLTLIAGPGAPRPGIAAADDLRPRALALACFLAGAVAGGVLLKVGLWLPLAIALLLSLLVAVALGRTREAFGAVG